jgi:CRISPR/Cas system CSM-associated protein Csm3 (group 7 of RAMP superfamily)
MSNWNESRRIATRLVITGNLELLSPAHLGNGETEGLTDMPLLRDALENRPLLIGTSIAGALRSYLQSYIYGHFAPEEKVQPDSEVALLFGGVKGDEDGEQSRLIVDDALSEPVISEVRDGVKIDAQKRVALYKGKYDVELLPIGTVFPLCLELLLPPEEDKADKLRSALASALEGFEKGQIAIGARRTRGFGRCQVKGWQATEYKLQTPDGLIAWLKAGQISEPELATNELQCAADLLKVKQRDTDQRHTCRIEAFFDLESPLLIRAEQPLVDGDEQPDFVHLRDNLGRPIISGSSLTGVVRARAERILNTIGHRHAVEIMDRLFGRDMHAGRGKPTASRLIMNESFIEAGQALVQQRVAIDRFTGGALETALFSEAPQICGSVTLRMEIRNPQDAEKGLLLLLLKDLWTSDLPIGGTSSIGRGQLRGRQATVELNEPASEKQSWQLTKSDDGKLLITGSEKQLLEQYVAALTALTEETNDT